MIKRITAYLNEGNIFYGLEVYEHLGTKHFHLLEVHRKKQELFIVDQKTCDQLVDIAEFINKDAPLFLTINTTNVITKIINPTKNIDLHTIVNNAFPNLDFDSFYCQVQPSEKSTIISISKKENIDSYLKKLNEIKISVVGFSLGFSRITTILSFLNSDTIDISNSRLSVEENTIRDIVPLIEKELPAVYNMNSLKIPAESILNFGAILGYISNDKGILTNFDDTLHSLNSELKNKRHYNLLLKSSLILVFGILFFNFLFFNHYFEKVGELQATSEYNSSNKNKLSQLQSLVRQKEERVNAVLSASNSTSSLYLDKIAQSVPGSVLLNEVQYQPLLKPMRESKPVELDMNTLVISGIVNNGTDFSNWIESLEQFKWVKSVETLDYDYDNSSTSKFSLKINMYEN